MNSKTQLDLPALYQLFLNCTGVTTDSRRCPEGSLFIALRGETFNGNEFAQKALDNGCAAAVVDDPACVPAGDTRYFLTNDTLDALQQLARHHRKQLRTPLLAITGTNGKTTTKELVAAVLQQKYHLIYTEGNLNNHIGVPLTLLRLKPEHQLAVVEMGASHPGDINELVVIADPDYGLVTNVGKAHLEGFGSFDAVVSTKGELFDYLRQSEEKQGVAFVHSDDDLLTELARELIPVTYGSREDFYVNGSLTACSPYLAFTWKNGQNGQPHTVQTRLIGSYNLPNALAAVAVGCYFGVDADLIDTALEAYVPRNNRSQLVKTADNTLIVDAYNANPTSMKAALSNFEQMEADRKMLILGDMRELGTDSLSEHQHVVDYLETHGFDDAILVGEQFAQTTRSSHAYSLYPDVSALIEALKRNKPKGKTILIKGSNSLRLSSITDYL